MPHPRPTTAPQPGTIRIHYARRDRSYDRWGLHLWGPALAHKRSWHEPLRFQRLDDFGAYVDVQIDDLKSKLSFVIHRDGDKDVASDRLLLDMVRHREFWLKQGRADVWTVRPQAQIELIRAELLTHDELVALADDDVARFAWMQGDWSLTKSPGPALSPRTFLRIHSHDGEEIPLREEKREGRHIFARTAKPLDLSKNYFVSLGLSRVAAQLSGGLLDREFYYEGNDLGATLLEDGGARLKLWSPPATRVVAHLYERGAPGRELGARELTREAQGVWSVTLAPADLGRQTLEGCFYQYEVTAFGSTERALDPYARSMAAFAPESDDPVGKAAIVDPARVDPPAFREDRFSNFGRRGHGGIGRLGSEADLIAYELHVRDFTIDPASGVPEPLRGTYPGLVSERPLRYLADLGITHVQLMPVQMIQTVDEADHAFRDGASGKGNYNWGYDPKNYFTPSGWFSTDPQDPYARVRELKEMVQALHARGIGVIVDVVYNHTYETRIFENVAPGCYYRLEGEGLVSNRTGAGPSVETRRRMVRKLIVDSLRHFVEQYHVDGFRFDLMGFLDHETMRAVREELGPDILLHGEAWDLTDLPGDQATTKTNLPDGARVAAFSDSTRDAVTGRMAGRGFVQGMSREAPRVRAGLMGNLRDFPTSAIVSDSPYERFARDPGETLNYLTIHDGFTLWDKLTLSYEGTSEEIAGLGRLAMAMLFTAQGRMILQAGDEFGRTKPLTPLDPTPDRAHGHPGVREEPDLPGVWRFHENSYSSPDWTNMVRWERLEREPFRSMAAYARELARMRHSLPAMRYATAEQVQRGLRFIGKPVQMPAPSRAMLAGYHSFAQLPELTIVFINGPATRTCFLAGEIFPEGGDKNPAHGAHAVYFDERGEGRVRFTQEEIARFDLNAWGDPAGLQVKLVTEPARWNAIFGAYSHHGNNTIRPEAVLRDHTVIVDLAAEDHVAGQPAVRWSYVAYELDNTLHAERPVEFDRLLVVHNADRGPVHVEAEQIEDPRGWAVLLDGKAFDANGLSKTEVLIGQRVVRVPRQSAAVIGRRVIRQVR